MELGRSQLVNTVLLAVLVGLAVFFLSGQVFVLRRSRTSLDDHNNNLELATPVVLFLPDKPDDDADIDDYDVPGRRRTVQNRRRDPDRTRTAVEKERPEAVKGGGDDDDDGGAVKRSGKTVEMAMKSVNKKKRPAFSEALKRVVGKDNRPPDSHYNINVTLSDSMSLDRPLPDTRPSACLKMTYDIDLLSKVSVIIPFFNEAPTMILRTVHSVLNRSPDQLIEEIILGENARF